MVTPEELYHKNFYVFIPGEKYWKYRKRQADFSFWTLLNDLTFKKYIKSSLMDEELLK